MRRDPRAHTDLGDADRSSTAATAVRRVLVSVSSPSMYKLVANPRRTGDNGSHAVAYHQHSAEEANVGDNDSDDSALSCQLGGHQAAAK